MTTLPETLTFEVTTSNGVVVADVNLDPGILSPTDFMAYGQVVASLPTDTEAEAELAGAVASVVMQVLRSDPDIDIEGLTDAVRGVLG